MFRQLPDLYISNYHKHNADASTKKYVCFVSAMALKLDESVGRVVKALQTSGMLENSIIVFVSDNGAPSSDAGPYQNWGSNYPLRGVCVNRC
jgi:arylsulfatase A-like enzyme